MSSLPRVKASPALLPRALVSLGALVAIAWSALQYGSGAARAGPGFATELLVLAVVGALRARLGGPAAHRALGGHRVRLRRAARPGVAAPRPRGPRRGYRPAPRARAHHRHRGEPLRDAPRGARRRAAARAGTLPGDRGRHQPRSQLRPHPRAHAPPGALGADGVRAL